MSTVEYVAGLALALLVLIGIGATVSMLMHDRRALTDHGPDCWWCHPRLPGRRR